ncbi:hypothetical protein [Micromonospora auratinigra]|uniref:Uncharacterized protein n=1 Tax=Micromonospora auratinigra TaxID=261654 RepID=A0A1A9A6U0_9ACTN|nr:hypothetical protein [Micromonospora auratinigra]SBT51815.1 hypothetical protein GA0070611_5355 [Micromonospora auratinigra]
MTADDRENANQRIDPTWDDPARVARRAEMREQMLAVVDDAGDTGDPEAAGADSAASG